MAIKICNIIIPGSQDGIAAQPLYLSTVGIT